MRFEKTNNDIHAMDRLSSENIGLYETLEMVMNVLQDVRTESQRELRELSVSGEAAVKWMAVANALLSVRIEPAAKDLSQRTKERIPALKQKLSEEQAGIKAVEAELTALSKEEKELTRELEECERQYRRLEEAEQNARTMKEQISALKAAIRSIDSVDTDALKAEHLRILKEKNEKQARINQLKSAHQAEQEELDEKLEILRLSCEKAQNVCLARSAEIERLQQELELSDRTISEADHRYEQMLAQQLKSQAKIQALTDRENALKQDFDELREKEQNILYRIEYIQYDIDQCSKKIADADRKLEEKNEESAQVIAKKESLEQLYAEADVQLKKALDENGILERELDTINKRIEDLTMKNPELKAEIAAKQEELEQQIRQKDSEIRALSDELTKLNSQLSEAESRRNELQAEKSQLEKEIGSCTSLTDTLQDELTVAQAQKDAAEAEKFELQRKAKAIEQELGNLQADIRYYQQFFDSEDCEKKMQEIARCKQITKLYQDGIMELFHADLPIEHIKELQPDFNMRKEYLQNQLYEVQKYLKNLRTEYLDVVSHIEKEMNL